MAYNFHDLLVGSNVLFIQQSLHKAFSSSSNNSLSDIVNSLRELWQSLGSLNSIQFPAH
jgi:hypothetical protein